MGRAQTALSLLRGQLAESACPLSPRLLQSSMAQLLRPALPALSYPFCRPTPAPLLHRLPCRALAHGRALPKPRASLLPHQAQLALSAPSAERNPLSFTVQNHAKQQRFLQAARKEADLAAGGAVTREAGGVEWGAVERWVVFSDLHLSRRSSSICLQVLERVHQEALKRDAGVLFLGDFWHERGALPVEPLNAVLAVFRRWQRPTLMIPGNHDQVNIGGEVHALTPLAAASPWIRVLSEPTVFLNALWVPYRRDQQAVLDALEEHKHVAAVFCHIDVVGGWVNESFQASVGLLPSQLRADVPIYTGHYHRPHSVEGCTVQYVGSPYQVSRSEAGQQKHLLLLNSAWQVEEEILLDIGPRHFHVEGPEPARQLPEDLRAGDRVRWAVPAELAALATRKKRTRKKSTADDPVAEEAARLAGLDVELELVYPAAATPARIAKAEELDVFSLFGAYCKNASLSPAAQARGVTLLRSLDLPPNRLSRAQARVVFHRVEVEGYGPFLNRTEYLLGPARGLRIVSGDNRDASGAADSNGAGKTTLVMAPLWALTGSTDPRPDAAGGLTNAEVVNDEAGSARVRLEGVVNGRPFVVERSAGRKAGLRFEVDGQDLTEQEIKMTQQRISDLIDPGVLARAVFHGQHAVGGLLEAGDVELKRELSRVVAMDVWGAATEAAKQQLKAAKAELDYLEGAVAELQRSTADLQARLSAAEASAAGWAQEQAGRLQAAQAEAEASAAEAGACAVDCEEGAAQLLAAVGAATAGAEIVEGVLRGVEAGRRAQQAGVSPEEVAAERELRELEMQAREASWQVAGVVHEVEGVRRRREAYLAQNAEGAVCERCLQPIGADHFARGLARLDEEVARAALQRAEAQQRQAQVEEQCAQVRQRLEAAALQREALAAAAEADEEVTKAAFWRQGAPATWRQLAEARRLATEAAELAVEVLGRDAPAAAAACAEGFCPGAGVGLAEALAGHEQSMAELVVAEEHVTQQLVALKQARAEAKLAAEELQQTGKEVNPHTVRRDTLAQLLLQKHADAARKSAQRGEVAEEAGQLGELSVAFGLTGIQSFVLEGALSELQARTARYLDTLSGGSLTLTLSSTKTTKSTKKETERISKGVLVRLGDGRVVERSLRQLSGGERRRQALALALAYADFAAERSGLHCDLIVLDEALQHLDSEGSARVVDVLRGLPQGTVLVVSQAHSKLAGAFDLVDWVIKEGNSARIKYAEDT